MWTRIYWSVSAVLVSLMLNPAMVLKNGEKNVFYDLKQLTYLLWQWRTMWRKLNRSRTCFNYSESQESCDSLAKINFMRATFQKFGAVCDHVRKNAEASRNYWVIYLKSKHSREHCIYNESWLNNKIEKYIKNGQIKLNMLKWARPDIAT